jgi:hypothetical protein
LALLALLAPLILLAPLKARIERFYRKRAKEAKGAKNKGANTAIVMAQAAICVIRSIRTGSKVQTRHEERKRHTR